jgi:hypothetical protein
VVADLYLYHAFYGGEADRPKLSLTLPSPSVEGVNF